MRLPHTPTGPLFRGGDSHGYYPKGGQERIFSPPVGAPESFKVAVWEGNFWDNNHAEVKSTE